MCRTYYPILNIWPRKAEQLTQAHTDSIPGWHATGSWLLTESATAHSSGPLTCPLPWSLGTGTQLVLGAEAFPSTALTHQPSKPLSWACFTPHWGGQTKLLVLGLFFYFQMDLFAGSIQGLPPLHGGQGRSARLILGGSRKKRQSNAAPHRVLGCSTTAASEEYSWGS